MWNSISNLIGTIWNGIVSGVRNGINTMMGVVRSVKDSVVGFFSDAGSWLWDAGSAIVSGLADGIRSAVGKVTGAIEGVMSKVRSFLPFSPAKKGPFSGKGWTLYSGQSMVEGLASGWTQRSDKFLSSVIDTMDRGNDALGLLTPKYRNSSVGIQVDSAIDDRVASAAEGTYAARGEEWNVSFGDIVIPLEDLEQLKTVEDLLEMLKKVKTDSRIQVGISGEA